MRLSVFPLILVTGLMGSVGCQQEAPITTYRIPTTVPAALAREDTRMLAAIIPQEKQAWFFKVMGRQSAIDSVAEQFKSFVQEVEFTDGKPVLENLPDRWREGASRQMRFASIDIETPTEQLDVSISQLSRMSDWDQLVAMNVNRWRGQVGLDESEETWAGAEKLDREPLGDTPAIWVDVIGRPSESKGSSMAPFAGRFDAPEGDPHAGLPREAQEAVAAARAKQTASQGDEPEGNDNDREAMKDNAASSKPKLDFETPEGWRDGRMSMMRMAAFNVGPEDAQAEVTVIAAGGDLRGNVKRWMGQIRPGGVDDEQVDEALANAQKLDVAGREAQRFVLLPDPDADNDSEASQTGIDATIVPLQDGFSLFVKMTGPADTLQQQDQAMQQFLKSLTYQ